MKPFPEFIADVMLGKLAKWLRILGFYTLYDSKLDDITIVQLAKERDLIILTKDHDFLNYKDIKDRLILLKSSSLMEQIVQIFEELKIKKLPPPLSICLECNSVLKQVKKEEVFFKLPPYIAKTAEEIFVCNKCGKLYWKGSHAGSMREKINSIVDRLKKLKLI